MEILRDKKEQNHLKSIWMLSREYRGIAEAGGLKDVCRGLAESLVQAGYKVSVVLPCYGFIRPGETGFEDLGPRFEVDMAYAYEERRERVGFWHQELEGVELVLVEAERFREKLGIYTYTGEEEIQDPGHRKGEGHYDYFAMNILLQKAALDLAIYTGVRPDVFHCHDAHTCIVPAMIREIDGLRQYFRDVGVLITIHNAGIGYHQDVADLSFAKAITGLPQRIIYSSLLSSSFDPFLAGAIYAPVNTVSENYAKELQNTELDASTGWLGHALKDRGIHIEGITNGIDPDKFNPMHPERLGLPAAFDPASGAFSGKAICRKELVIRLMSIENEEMQAYGSIEYIPDQPLVTVVSRLTEQKGLDVLAQALEGLLAEDRDMQVIILGSGKKEIEDCLAGLAGHPDREGHFMVLIGYNPGLADLIYASGDFFVIPSLYEPCGITDFIAQLMGNLPIVRATGGLVKVKDGFNGFSYRDHTPAALAEAVRRALKIYRDLPDVIRRMQADAVRHIRENYTWDKVRERYVKFYKKAIDMCITL